MRNEAGCWAAGRGLAFAVVFLSGVNGRCEWISEAIWCFVNTSGRALTGWSTGDAVGLLSIISIKL
jgi:hypothetical protein